MVSEFRILKKGVDFMPALALLVLILTVVLWYFCTSLFGKKTYDNAEKMYKNLTEEEPVENPGEETKGEQE